MSGHAYQPSVSLYLKRPSSPRLKFQASAPAGINAECGEVNPGGANLWGVFEWFFSMNERWRWILEGRSGEEGGGGGRFTSLDRPTCSATRSEIGGSW